MNFQQLRSVREAVRRGFNLTEVARVLHTSQPGVSRQVQRLERELAQLKRVGSAATATAPAGASEVVAPVQQLADSNAGR